eukprot:14231886-Ditylum_brightwellii.AAC.1
MSSSTKARTAAKEAALLIASRSSSTIDNNKYVWNFSFGANINPWKLQTKRKIQPVEVTPGQVLHHRLLFNHRGGFGTIEHTQSAPNNNNSNGLIPTLSPKIPQPNSVHGILLKLHMSDFGKLAAMEHQYIPREITVSSYDGRTISALAFITPPQYQIARTVLPSTRYIGLITRGAREMKLDESYCDWLEQIPSVEDKARGDEYYTIVSSSSSSGGLL